MDQHQPAEEEAIPAAPSIADLPLPFLESSAATLPEIQRRVDHWIQTIGVRYFSELTNLAQLVEEVGELARLLNRTYGEQSFKKGATPGDLGDEMADILFVLVCLANQTGVDLGQALEKNLQKKTTRDSRRHLENPKLQPNDEST